MDSSLTINGRRETQKQDRLQTTFADTYPASTRSLPVISASTQKLAMLHNHQVVGNEPNIKSVVKATISIRQTETIVSYPHVYVATLRRKVYGHKILRLTLRLLLWKRRNSRRIVSVGLESIATLLRFLNFQCSVLHFILHLSRIRILILTSQHCESDHSKREQSSCHSILEEKPPLYKRSFKVTPFSHRTEIARMNGSTTTIVGPVQPV